MVQYYRMDKQPWANRIVAHGEEAPEQLLANPLNWRIHPKAQQDALATILDKVGWVQDVIVNRATDTVIDGHLRVALAISRGEASVPVVYVELTPDEEKLVLAGLDSLAHMAVTDGAQLTALLKDIADNDASLLELTQTVAAEMGVDIAPPIADAPDAPTDRAAELQVKWQTARGQVWQVGRHRVMCGDSTSAEDVAVLMGGAKADMVFTDPPYGVDYEGGRNPISNTPREKLKGDTDGDVYGLFMPVAANVVKPTAAWYVWFADRSGKPVYEAVESIGLTVRAMIVWNKLEAHYGNFMAQYMQKHEPCLYCVRDTPIWNGPTNEVTVWDVKQPTRNENHPTEKPVELAVRAMNNSGVRDSLVVDFFLGSGTTVVAAEQLGRVCYGMEISPAYTAVVLERLSLMGLVPELL